MADKSVRVEVRGIRELQKAFKEVDANLPKALKAEFLAVAQAVVSVAASRVPVRSGRAARSVKARASARGASIAFGGTAAPYFPWLDFGGTTGRGHSSGGGGAIKRPFTPPGRYVYPAISEKRDDTREAIDHAIERVVESAGFETKGGV